MRGPEDQRELFRRPRHVHRLFIGAGALAGAAILLWFALGMSRGTLLSNDIKSAFWPWAPSYPERPVSRTVLSDPVWQFVPWLEFARQELQAGRLPLWNPHQNAGVPLLGNMQSALGSPLVWPVLLLGVVPGWNVGLLLRLLLALVGAFVWLRDLGRSPLASGLGALGFALSGPFIAWLEHPHTATAAAVPLLLLYAGRVARRASRTDFVGLALATYLVLAGGHPETQFLAALLAIAVVMFEASRAWRILPALAGVLLGAGLAAPLLFPFLEYFRLSEARVGIDRTTYTLPLRDLLRFFAPGLSGSNAIEAAATVSVALLLLVPFGLVKIPCDRRVLFWSAVAVFLLAVVYENPVSRFLAGHTAIYWTRALLLLPLPLGYLASTGLDAVGARLENGSRRALAVAVPILLVLASVLELLFAAQGVHARTRLTHLSPPTPLLARLRADPDVFRVLGLHTFLAPNSATDYGLDDIRGYDALEPLGWRRRRAEIGRFMDLRHQTDVIEPWNLVSGGRALDFWNVKYLLFHPQFAFGPEALNQKRGLDLEEIYAGPDGRILQNRRALARARVIGSGRVRILERLPMKWGFEVDLATSGSLLIANPAFPGWEARVDGRATPIRAAPGDPIEVPVPAGRHEVKLVYRPLSVRSGLAVAAASGLILAILAWRRHSPPGEPEER